MWGATKMEEQFTLTADAMSRVLPATKLQCEDERRGWSERMECVSLLLGLGVDVFAFHRESWVILVYKLAATGGSLCQGLLQCTE
jgi:hypothetical protein